MTIEKQANPLFRMGYNASKGLLKGVGKATFGTGKFGGKSLWGAAKFTGKRPGLAFGGALGGIFGIEAAHRYTKAGLKPNPGKRVSFKMATEGGQSMSTDYPSFLYEIDGFEQMASNVKAAHELVKRAGRFSRAGRWIADSLLRPGARRMPFDDFVKNTKLHDALFKDWRTSSKYTGSATNRMKQMYKEFIDETASVAANKQSTPREIFVTSLPLAAAVATPSIMLASSIRDSNKERRELNSAFQEMYNIYPELKREKPDDVKKYHSYISMYSPTVAKNPHAAGAAIRNATRSGGALMDQSLIEGLLKVEETRAKGMKAKSDSSALSKMDRVMDTKGKVDKYLGGAINALPDE